MLTSQPTEHVAKFLTALVSPHAIVASDGQWMPRGFLEPNEPKLDQPLFSDEQRRALKNWWLKNPNRANTPNWDLVARALVDRQSGLVLVEAKAHPTELKPDDECVAKGENRTSITAAIAVAERDLNSILPGWSLKSQSHYQISNRFAFAWKLASLGVPVVLVYLGFLRASEMDSKASPMFQTADQWRDCLLKYATDVVPPTIWERSIKVNGTPLIALIRAAEVHICTEPASSG